MTSRFMMSVAAVALLAGTGFANAQGTGGANREGSSAAPSAQQSAPSGGGSGAQMNRDWRPRGTRGCGTDEAFVRYEGHAVR